MQDGFSAWPKSMALPAGCTGRADCAATSNGAPSGPATLSSLPSHQENFGVAVVESLAAGRPVLISNQVNIWPEIEGDGVGLVDDDTRGRHSAAAARAGSSCPPRERDAMAAAAPPSFMARVRHEPGGGGHSTVCSFPPSMERMRA